MNTSRCICCHTYKPQLVEHVRETCYRPHSVTPGGVPNTDIVRNVLRLLNSSAKYRRGKSSGPIRTSHNLHNHTNNTHQSEPQLKDSSYSSAILSHNARDVIPSHNSRNATCFPLSEPQLKGYYSVPQLKEHSNKSLFKVLVKPCRPHTSQSKQITSHAFTLSLGVTTEPPSKIQLQTV